MRSLIIACLCCLSFGVHAQSPAKSKKAKPVTVFSVNKKNVTADEFVYLYKKNHQNKSEDFTHEKIQEYLDLFINFKLKVEEARHRGYDTATAFKTEYNSYKDELRKPYLPDAKIVDSLVKLTYSRLKEEVRASHILVMVNPEAAPEDTLKAYNKIGELRSRAMAGEDFGTLASNYSEDPSAKMNQGDLGYFSALQMVYPFETGAYETPVNQISKVLRTRFGYHILKVTGRQPARGEVEVSHIMIRTGENKDNEKAKNTIFEVYDQLQAGRKWDDLCKQYSEDPGTKDNAGRMRPFGVGALASVPAFESAAFSLKNPGDMTDPFQSQYGWHIVRLEKKIPVQSFDEMAASLKGKVSRDERVQLSRQAMQTKFRREYKLVEVDAVKAKVLALADSTLKEGKWKTPARAPQKDVLFSLQGKPYTAGSFMTYVVKNQRSNTLAPQKYLTQLYNNYIDASISTLIEEQLISTNADYRMLLNEYYEGILLFEIMEKEVWNKATDDSVGQKKYYDQHAASYTAKERAQAILYSSGNKDVVPALVDLIDKKDSAALAAYCVAEKVKRESGRFEKEEKAVLGKINWAPGLYPAENNNLYYLIEIRKIVPPGPKTFEEARASVIADYQTYLEKEWVAGLKKKYPVRINEKGKAFVVEQLQKP